MSSLALADSGAAKGGSGAAKGGSGATKGGSGAAKGDGAVVPVTAVAAQHARASAEDDFVSAVMDAARLLAADFPECSKFAAAHAALAAECDSGAEAKHQLLERFVGKCSSMFARVASACDDDVLEFVFALDEARAVDLKGKYYAYDANGRTCLVEHLKAICYLASCADTLHKAAAMMPSQFDEWTEQISQGMSSGASLPEMFSALLPKAFEVVKSMSGSDQMNLVSMMQTLAGQPNATANATASPATGHGRPNANANGNANGNATGNATGSVFADDLAGIIGGFAQKYAAAIPAGARRANAASEASAASAAGAAGAAAGDDDAVQFSQVLGMVNQAFQSMKRP